MPDQLIEDFLELYSSEQLKKEYRLALMKFFEWLKKTPKQITDGYKQAEDKNQ